MLRFSSWKVALVLGICLLGLVYSLPNLFPRAQMERMPDWLPHEQINLGLDLQGGSHLLLEVQLGAVIRERLEFLVDDVRGTLRSERIGYRGLGVRGDAVTLTLTDPASAPRALDVLEQLDQGGMARELMFTQAGDRIEIRLAESVAEEMQEFCCGAVPRDRAPADRRGRYPRAHHPAPGRQIASWCRFPARRIRTASSACSARPPS